MIAPVNRLSTESPSELSDIRYCRIIQGLKSVLVECLNTFFKTNFNAICKQVVLP
jgi:hypothetical protein